MKVKGIIIRLVPYHEHGAMVNLLTSDGVLSFYAGGIYKLDSKNSVLTAPLLYAEFTFNDRLKSTLTFKEVNPLIDTRTYLDDFAKLAALNFLNEVTLRLIANEEMSAIYPYLFICLSSIDKSPQIIMSLLLSYLAISLRLAGYGLNVDNYVNTSEKDNIIGVSYQDGGFVSKKAFRPSIHKRYTPNQCRILYQIFKMKLESLANVNFPIKDTQTVLNDLFIYTYDQTGVRFKSTALIKKLV